MQAAYAADVKRRGWTPQELDIPVPDVFTDEHRQKLKDMHVARMNSAGVADTWYPNVDYPNVEAFDEGRRDAADIFTTVWKTHSRNPAQVGEALATSDDLDKALGTAGKYDRNLQEVPYQQGAAYGLIQAIRRAYRDMGEFVDMLDGPLGPKIGDIPELPVEVASAAHAFQELRSKENQLVEHLVGQTRTGKPRALGPAYSDVSDLEIFAGIKPDVFTLRDRLPRQVGCNTLSVVTPGGVVGGDGLVLG